MNLLDLFTGNMGEISLCGDTDPRDHGAHTLYFSTSSAIAVIPVTPVGNAG